MTQRPRRRDTRARPSGSAPRPRFRHKCIVICSALGRPSKCQRHVPGPNLRLHRRWLAREAVDLRLLLHVQYLAVRGAATIAHTDNPLNFAVLTEFAWRRLTSTHKNIAEACEDHSSGEGSMMERKLLPSDTSTISIRIRITVDNTTKQTAFREVPCSGHFTVDIVLDI